MAVDRRLAGLLVQEALGAVVDPAIVATLREDSPLAAAGLSVTDAVCVARRGDGGRRSRVGVRAHR